MRDFLTAARLPSDDRDEILAAMKDVQLNGVPIAQHLTGDLYEVRVDGPTPRRLASPGPSQITHI